VFLSRRVAFCALPVIFFALTGCGSQVTKYGCVSGPLQTFPTGSPNFTLTPSSTSLTLYPGQVTQFPVQVQSVNGSTGTVQLTGFNDQGITVAPATAQIGSTTNLLVTVANNVAASCFTGVSGVFSAQQKLKITANAPYGGITQDVGVDIELQNPAFLPASTNLPVLSIATAAGAPVASEDDYVDATLTISDPTNASNNYSGTMEIKGHGNSTWIMPKKPYRLNLDKKAALLGMTSDSNWILLANYDDKSMLRNDVAMQMSQMFGMFWTPNNKFVEMYLNGQYEGTYELFEKVEVSKARLNIGSMDDTDISGTDLTGGYLAEIDHYEDETLVLNSMVGLPIGLADPDPPAAEQAAYFTQAFNTAEASMYAPNWTDPAAGWQAYWDKASLVNWFLIEELAGNQDADDFSSDYFYKPRGDARFYRGPVWDMDITMGNDNYGAVRYPNQPWVAVHSKWYQQLLKDPVFMAAVKAQWTAIRPQMLTLPSYIDSRAATLQLASQNNFARWPNLGEIVWPNNEAAGSYAGEITFMKSWLTQRIAYMDSQYLQ
jgi:hypothetical protein